MGSSCSSVKRKDRQKSRRSSSADSGPHVDLCGQRRCSERSIESLPYGAKSSPPSASKSSQQQEAQVSALSRSNGDTKHPTVDVNQSALDSARAARDDKFLAVNSASPLPVSPTVSPFTTPLATKQCSAIPDLSRFTSDVRSLLLGQKPDKFSWLPTSKQFFVIVCCNQKDTNFKHIEPISSHLQQLCNSKGYEFHVIDFHLSNKCKPIGDHSYDDICVEVLKMFSENNALVLNLFVEEADECMVSLPAKVDEADFEVLLQSMTPESQHLFRKWYALDINSSCPQFILQHINKLLPHLCSENVEFSTEAKDHWNSECIELCKLLDTHVVDELRRKYLLSTQQKQIDCVLETPSALKRSFLVRFESSNTQSNARLQSVLSLERQLPETQKVCVSTSSDGELGDGITSVFGSLKKVVENMMDDKSQEESQLIYSGIESSLFCELIQQERIRSETAYNYVGCESLFKRIESYINSSSNSPLVLYGLQGCGKSSFIAKFSRFASLNFPSFVVIHRSVGVSEESLTREQLFRSVCEQYYTLHAEDASTEYSNIKESLAKLVKQVPNNRSLLILLDGIDQLAPFPELDAVCLPQEISANIKMVLTVTTGSTLFAQLQQLFGEDNMVEVPELSVEESFALFTQLIDSKERRITNAQNDAVAICFQNCHSPVYAHVLANEAIHWRSEDIINESVIPKDISNLMNDVLTEAGRLIGIACSRFLFSFLCVSKHGFTDCQLIALLSWDKALEESFFSDYQFPYVYWFCIKNRFNYLFQSKLLNGKMVVSLKCLFKELLKKSISHEYLQLSRERIFSFFKQDCDICNTPEPVLNRVAAEELPFAAIQLKESSVSNNFIFDMEWMAYKFKASDSFHFLEDIDIYESVFGKEDNDAKLLKDVISVSAFALHYDGSQIFSQLYARLKDLMTETSNEPTIKYPKVKALFDSCCKSSQTNLFPLNTHFMSLRYDEKLSPQSSLRDDTDKTFCFLSVIKGKRSHVVSLSSDSGRIVVWDVCKEKAVRTLEGITQPRNLKMVDEHRALVLCNRELKVYNLNTGILESKLKGVMNQNMPFYGLHDDKYVVALSRNRMYVNMMNVVTGDLETQFKVGEDRFLNSLLVSANGKICVCGDETQKPFPLLVWDLSSRKLLYDLRIPHHEFITRLAAISDDGHYVVSVCKELSSTGPNFIIVYDLQSGTLFKKWKPECNTSSIAISSQGGFVLNGVENCRILVWDLSTGAKRHNLIGHSAPVDTLQIDDSGKSCLSFDSFAKDRSIRIWDAESGTCLAVFTPDYPLSCCQLSSDGTLVVFCFKRCSKLHTLFLCRQSSPESERDIGQETYGQMDLDGLVFDLTAS